MKNLNSKEHSNDNRDKMKRSRSVMMKNKKKNQQRLGGGGLSLEVFANAKTKDTNYNPSLIKKQREFYKNAKYVSKYKKSLKQLNEPQKQPFIATIISEAMFGSWKAQEKKPISWKAASGGTKGSPLSVFQQLLKQEGDETTTSKYNDKKNKRKSKESLEELYKNKRQEQEKARLEKEAWFQARKEAIEKTEAQRKVTREKMHKKTRSGQPVMKYRIEHILQSIQGSKN